jgi:hypothetical protein
MYINVKKIYDNAKKSLYTDINGKENKNTFQYYFVLFFIPFLSGLIVYFCRDKLLDDPKVIATLLSLFSGLMFGVLIKIPDKFKDLEPKEHESVDETFKRIQVKNYLKLFMYSLSYSILVALLAIFFGLLNSFFPNLISLNLNIFYFESDLNKVNWYHTIEFLFIVLYRFILVIFLLNFIFFIFKAVTNLYEFMIYEFNKIREQDEVEEKEN